MRSHDHARTLSRCSTLGPLEQPLALCAMRARQCVGALWLYYVPLANWVRPHRARCPSPRLDDDGVRRTMLGSALPQALLPTQLGSW